MKLRKLLSLIMVLALLLGTLTACGGASTGGETEASKGLSEKANVGSSKDGVGDDNRVEAGAENTGGVKDVVYLGVQSDPTNWAPWAPPANGRTVALNGVGIYQGFGYFINGEWVSQLAKDYVISEDGLTVTINMFEYITDHNGNTVDAHDAEFSFAKGVELGYITGVKYVDSLTAVSDYVVEVKLNRILGLGDIDTLMSYNIVSKKAYEESTEGMSTWAVGTGPYMLTEYTSGYSFTYSMNENYWQTDEQYIGVREGRNVKQIVYYIIAESAQRAIALENGTIDMCAEVSTDDLPKFMEGGVQAENYWTYGVYDNLCMYVYPNMTSGKVTDDVNLRNAIFYAINSQAVVDSVYNGLAVTCWDFGSRWVQGFDENWIEEESFYRYDLEKAKEYLTQSNYSGEELVILTEGTQDTSNTATLVQSMLLSIGINSRIEAVESSILGTYRENPDNWDLLVMKYACSQYTAKGYYMTMCDDRYAWGGTINFIYDDELQTLVDTVMTIDGNTQDNIQVLHEYVIDNAYGYNICNFVTNYVLSNKVDKVALTSSWAIIPGACTYVTE